MYKRPKSLFGKSLLCDSLSLNFYNFGLKLCEERSIYHLFFEILRIVQIRTTFLEDLDR